MGNRISVYNNRTKQEVEYIQLAKRELERYQDKRREIDNKRNRILHLESRINSVSRPPKEVSVQSQPDPKGIEDMLINAADLRRDYGATILQAEGICEHIEKLINLVDGIKGEMLYRRYVIGQSAQVIAHDHVYSVRQAYNLMDDGLVIIGKNIARHCTL